MTDQTPVPPDPGATHDEPNARRFVFESKRTFTWRPGEGFREADPNDPEDPGRPIGAPINPKALEAFERIDAVAGRVRSIAGTVSFAAGAALCAVLLPRIVLVKGARAEGNIAAAVVAALLFGAGRVYDNVAGGAGSWLARATLIGAGVGLASSGAAVATGDPFGPLVAGLCAVVFVGERVASRLRASVERSAQTIAGPLVARMVRSKSFAGTAESLPPEFQKLVLDAVQRPGAGLNAEMQDFIREAMSKPGVQVPAALQDLIREAIAKGPAGSAPAPGDAGDVPSQPH